MNPIIRQLLLGGGGAVVDGFNIASYFNTTVYTGSGAPRSITTGIDLANNPGMVMIGPNSASEPFIYDTLRGVGNLLKAGSSAAEANSVNTVTSFNANGYSYGAAIGNASGVTNAAWSFRKHPKLFNVITYTGNGAARSIAHGLSVAPGFVIIKSLGASNAMVWQKSLASDSYFDGWGPVAQTSDATLRRGIFGDGSVSLNPDTINVYLGPDATYGQSNTLGQAYVMYVFADDPTGYIASGTYVGNGSSTGPIVTLGWEPQWILTKARDVAQAWNVNDNVRDGGSPPFMAGSKPWAASAYNAFVVLSTSSTGFQLRSNDASVNTSGQTYLYTAIRKP